MKTSFVLVVAGLVAAVGCHKKPEGETSEAPTTAEAPKAESDPAGAPAEKAAATTEAPAPSAAGNETKSGSNEGTKDSAK